MVESLHPAIPDNLSAADMPSGEEPVATEIIRRTQACYRRNYEFIERTKANDRMYRGLGAELGPQEPGRPKARTGSMEYHRCIESAKSATDAVMFGDDPFFLPWSGERTDDDLNAMHNTRLVMCEQHEDMGFRTKAMASIGDGFNDGTVAAFVGWQRRFRHARMVNERGDVVYRKTPVYNGPVYKPIPMWRFFSDEETEVDDMTWFAREFEMSKSNLQELVNQHKEIKFAKTRDLNRVSWEGKYNSEGQIVSEYMKQARGYNVPVDSDLCHVTDYWGIHPTWKDPRDKHSHKAMPLFYRIMIVNGRDWVIQTVNPFHHGRLPLVVSRFMPNREQFHGLGMAELLRRKWMMINKRRNLMSDIVMMSLFGMWQRTGTSPHNATQKIKLYPGRVFDAMIHGVMKQLPIETRALRDGTALDQIDVEEMRAVTAATSNIQGLAQGGTATEIRNIAQEAARRIATFAVIFGNEVVRRFLGLQAMNNAQYLPDRLTIGEDDEEKGVKVRNITKRQMYSRPNIRMKIATDLEFRKPLLRNINQTTMAWSQMLQIDPRLAPVVEPMLIQLSKKTMYLFGENPKIDSAKVKALLEAPAPQTMPGEAPPPRASGGGRRA